MAAEMDVMCGTVLCDRREMCKFTIAARWVWWPKPRPQGEPPQETAPPLCCFCFVFLFLSETTPLFGQPVADCCLARPSKSAKGRSAPELVLLEKTTLMGYDVGRHMVRILTNAESLAHLLTCPTLL